MTCLECNCRFDKEQLGLYEVVFIAFLSTIVVLKSDYTLPK